MNDKPANRHHDLRSLIRDDAYAASFQSLGQYRTALLEYVAPAVQGEPVANTFYVLHDATEGQEYIRKNSANGCLAIFEREGDAQRAKRRHPGTEYKRVDYYTAPQPAEQQHVYQRCEYCDGTGDVHSIDGEWLGACDCQKTAPDVDVLVDASDRAAPAMNEHEEMKNAMQLAQGPKPTTLGELHDYLDSIRKAWSAQDTKYLGSYESQPLYILPNDPTPGFHLAKAKYFAEFGLTFIPVEGASK